jgi:HPt (histidine-containing phosphotransfer) domain-containing protein
VPVAHISLSSAARTGRFLFSADKERERRGAIAKRVPNEREKQSAVAELNKTVGADWDINELLERLEGDQQFLRELLNIFREDSAANLQKAKIALQARNLPEVMSAAHTMKGMLRNLSMHRAAEIAYVLETASREGNRHDAVTALSQLERACTELRPEVEAHLAGVEA